MAGKEWHKDVVADFRSHHGRVTVGPIAGMQLLLLNAKGARTGIERTYPLAYVRDGDRYVIVASKGGSPTNPDWYWNLIANPEAMIEVGSERIPVMAIEVKGAERQGVFDLAAATHHGFKEYEKTTPRVIPVFVLEKRHGG